MTAISGTPATATPTIDTPTIGTPTTSAATMRPSEKATGAQLLASFPPRPVAPSWPVTEASRSAVLGRVLAAPFALDNRVSQQSRRLGVLAVLNWLATHPGGSWQQRWRASGAEGRLDWRDLITPPAPAAGPLRLPEDSCRTWAPGCSC